jgi:hypothetical protein
LTEQWHGSEDGSMQNFDKFRFLRRALAIALYAIAMAYLEAAVVVYLEQALSVNPLSLFPVRNPTSLGGLGTIEVGREVATLFMLGVVGWLAGRNFLERLAWVAVAFGIWDIGYYAWLWVFIGWPTRIGTYDLLFLLPVPWDAPVWAPLIVSLALITSGLLIARRIVRGEIIHIKVREALTIFVGGLVVILSFTWDARRILAGGLPANFMWPIFVGGLVLAIFGVAPLCKSVDHDHTNNATTKSFS